MEGTPIILDEESARLFVQFQRYRDSFEVMLKKGLFESPFSQWKLCFNGECVLTNVFELEKEVYRR